METSVLGLSDIREIFPLQLKEFFRSLPSERKTVRLEIPIEPCDALKWLKQQTASQRIYWSDREGDLEAAGIGHADIVADTDGSSATILRKIIKKIPLNSRVRYYGGLCFDADNFASPWGSFGKCYFVLPRFEIVRTGAETVFACNLNRLEYTEKHFAQIISQFSGLSFALARHQTKKPLLKTRSDRPTLSQWQKTALAQIQKINKGTLKKVVLARQVLLEFSEDLNALDILARLKSISPNCYYFYFQPDASSAFLGASPERLYKRKGLNILTEALAGTRPRGRTRSDDQRLKNTLLNSEKDWHEHQLVADWIRNILNPMCSQFQSDRTFSALSLKGGHHLCTRMKGRLLETADDAALMERLHPTPAVAGWPKETALQTIKKSEPFVRGYYAAPLGYLGYDTAEFAVAIRSGLVQRSKISLYAGSGIVNASRPKEEWEEAENKLKVFFSALGL